MRLAIVWTILSVPVAISSLQAQAAHDPRLPQPGLAPIANGIWRLTVEQLVDPSEFVHQANPECSGEYRSGLEAVMNSVRAASTKDPRLGLVLPILSSLSSQIAQFARSQPGDIAKWLEPDRYANCAPIGVRTGPAIIHNVRYWISDGARGASECRDIVGGVLLTCGGIGFAGWDDWVGGLPVQVQVGFISTFKNWSHDRHRWANITVDFQPPPGIIPQLAQ